MQITDAALRSKALSLFHQGTFNQSYQIFGAHPVSGGIQFTLWCPGAAAVSVIGDFSGWDPLPLLAQGDQGVFSAVISQAKVGDRYKYRITAGNGKTYDKADPYAFSAEARPGTASRVVSLTDYPWSDGTYRRAIRQTRSPRPLNIYEVHLGSWKQQADPTDPALPFLSYRQMAEELIPYVRDMGYTHIELMPVMEHPYDGSWGYQVTGYFAPTSRYGGPKDLMFFIDQAHKWGLGVILDWVPGHFCRDDHGLGRFNGEMLYEGADHPQWGTYKFDFGRPEVRSFLLSSAHYWLTVYHADGLRVDGVSSMLYLNFGLSDQAEKTYNENGGEENLQAISFLQELNDMVHTGCPGCLMIAEESTPWPYVTGPTDQGGLGFDLKWDMGWMNDTLSYFREDFPWRRYHHDKLTFSMVYSFSEKFLLPLSHDEVVHGKKSLLGKMPGDYWRQFAGLRLLAMYQATHPGGMLSFMSSEYGPFIEWREYESLEWFMLDFPAHHQHREYVRTLNLLYRSQAALWQDDRSWDGFHWLEVDNRDQGILVYRRTGKEKTKAITVLLNFQPDVDFSYRIGVPYPGDYVEIINSDMVEFGGSGKHNPGVLHAEPIPHQGEKWSLLVTTPPLGGMMLQKVPRRKNNS